MLKNSTSYQKNLCVIQQLQYVAYLCLMFLQMGCTSQQQNTFEQQSLTAKYDSLFEQYQGTSRWIPKKQRVSFNRGGMGELQVPKSEVLSLVIHFNAVPDLNLDSLYQFENIIAFRFELSLKHSYNAEGGIVIERDMKVANILRKLDFKKFKYLQEINFSFDPKVREDAEKILSTATYVKYVK